jgi:[acyl-carrier-protein] S-malonyltransferase
MGRDLVVASPLAQEAFAEATEVLGYDLARVCFEGPAEVLGRTDVTQPALLTTSIALLRVLRERGFTFDVALGHSLGEYTALVATEALEFAQAVRLVRQRGEAMLAAGRARPGGMAAVLGLDAAAVEELCASIVGVWPANYNSPGQVVVSGTEEGLARLAERAPAVGARRVVRLPVSGAFHSPLVESAAEALRAPLGSARFAAPQPAFFSTSSLAFESAEGLADLLLRQITAPVRWEQAVRALVQAGYDVFVEVGPGNVLTGLIKRIDNGVETVNVADLATLEAALESPWRGERHA